MTTNNASIEELVFQQGRELSDHRTTLEILAENVDELSNYINQLENRCNHSRYIDRLSTEVRENDVSIELRDLRERISGLEARELQLMKLHEMYSEYCKELSLNLYKIELRLHPQSSTKNDTHNNNTPFGVNICGWVAVAGIVAAAVVLYFVTNMER
jgi:hypothetical protein